jgi:glycogen debranching enzyme
VRRAETLQAHFDSAFWGDELGTYAVALDGDKRPCRVRTSNAAQCLFSGIVFWERAAGLAKTLLAPESFSGWGIRTVAASEPRYNPMGYHNGGVWPHDPLTMAVKMVPTIGTKHDDFSRGKADTSYPRVHIYYS